MNFPEQDEFLHLRDELMWEIESEEWLDKPLTFEEKELIRKALAHGEDPEYWVNMNEAWRDV